MNGDPADPGTRLAELLAGIARADALARNHDLVRTDRELHAEAAQHADEAAETKRRAARALIESAFPGISWSMIERAAL